MKNFFSDNFHQIIYIIPAPSTPAPRPLYPRPARFTPVLPRPPVHPPNYRNGDDPSAAEKSAWVTQKSTTFSYSHIAPQSLC